MEDGVDLGSSTESFGVHSVATTLNHLLEIVRHSIHHPVEH